MKFKVGDKVRVKKDLEIDKSYGGLVYTRAMHDGYSAKVLIIDEICTLFGSWYYIKGDNDKYGWTDDMLESFDTFTKSDLKDGMVVEYRHGWMELVLGEKTVDDRGSHSLCNFDNNLINKDSRESDIMRVYTVNGDITCIGCIFDRACLTLIWERKEEPTHKEMTVEEIEKELGYKIKVVGDASCQK